MRHKEKLKSKKIAKQAQEVSRIEQKLKITHALDEKFAKERADKRESFAEAVVGLVQREGVAIAQKSIALHLHLS